MKCKLCDKPCIKRGIRNSIQQYFCRSCKKYQRETYRNYRINYHEVQKIILFNNEGISISSISRLLKRSKSTIIRYIKAVERTCIIEYPDTQFDQEYEMDEIMTFIGRKKIATEYICWIMYAIERQSRKPFCFCVGRRSKENLRSLASSLEMRKPQAIFTDRLNLYSEVIDPQLHNTKRRGTNRIERKNLTLRTHLKRLSRKTICFSRSLEMLNACLSIYFIFKEWNTPLPNSIGVNERCPSFRNSP